MPFPPTSTRKALPAPSCKLRLGAVTVAGASEGPETGGNADKKAGFAVALARIDRTIGLRWTEEAKPGTTSSVVREAASGFGRAGAGGGSNVCGSVGVSKLGCS